MLLNKINPPTTNPISKINRIQKYLYFAKEFSLKHLLIPYKLSFSKINHNFPIASQPFRCDQCKLFDLLFKKK